MPISETMAGSVAEFLLLNPDTTVDQAYRELTQPRRSGIHLLTWIAIPAFAGLIITRWAELEQITTLADFTFRYTSPNASRIISSLCTRLPCVTITPFGSPVEPEVYCNKPRSDRPAFGARKTRLVSAI